MARRIILASLLAAVSTFAMAQTALEHQANAALSAKQYSRAATLMLQVWEQGHAPEALYYAAVAYAQMGDAENALRTLQRAVDAGYANSAGTAKDADLASLRGDPRFIAVVAAMKARQEHDARLFASPALATPYRDNISDDEKVAGLSKFWSEVKYNFVYVERLKQLDWDKLYLDYLPKVRATASTADYYRVLMELCARLQDGHTNVYPSIEVWDSQLASTKIRTRLVENRVLVSDVFDPALRAQGVLPGVEVVAVDGEPPVAYGRRTLAPYLSASTAQDRDARTFGYFFLSGPRDQQPRVTFADAAGKRFDLALQRYDSATVKKSVTPRPPFALRMLPGDVAYVALNSFENDAAADQFIAAFDQIGQAKALVIDVRDNGGGNSGVGYRVLATLTAAPFATSRWSTRKYLPVWRAWGRAMPDSAEKNGDWKPDPQHQFTLPVRVLTSAFTYSAAEDFAVAFDSMQRGTIVGETTGGSTGQPLMISLPGGGRARICTKADTYPDGRVWVGVGIRPALEVHPTVADVQKGKDTVLDAALASLRL